MNIEIDKIYKFQFKNEFSLLNGIYRCTHKLNLTELISSDVNMSNSLYSKVNKTSAEWDADVLIYKDDVFLKLDSPEDDTMEDMSIYIPTMLVDGYPDPNVQRYQRLVLGYDLGIFKDPGMLTTATMSIQETMDKEIGTDSIIDISVYDHVWLTDTEYQSIEQQRVTNRQNVVNYYSESVRLTNELTQKRAEITYLKSLVSQMEARIQELLTP
jgi:hypothetical protein